MKKITIILLLGLFLLLPVSVHCAGTVTQIYTRISSDMWLWQMDWTADASDGSVPSTTSKVAFDHYVIIVITNPGSPAPTDNYDITLTDSDGIDVMGGELIDRDKSSSEQALPKIGNVYGTRWVNGTLTMNLTNNSVNSATGTIKVFLQK